MSQAVSRGSMLRDVDTGRLDSWKEIASFLHRDARTVRRWERDRKLPVHRVPGGERSGVFAYVGELEEWLHAVAPVAEVASPEKIALVPQKVAPVDSPAQDLGADEFDQMGEPGASRAEAGTAGEAAVGACLGTAGGADTKTPISALHSINTFAADFTAEDATAGAMKPVEVWHSASTSTLERSRGTRAADAQVIFLLFFLSITIGASFLFVRYRETRRTTVVAHRPTAEAQELYLRGRYYWNLRTEDGLTAAVDFFTQSIVNDPHYAAAYAGLADSYLLLRQYGHMPNTEAFPRALAATRQAIALDDSSPDAHRSLAFILRFWNWDMAAAEKEYRRAIKLNPNDSQSHHWYATALLSSDRNEEAMREIDIARQLEPQSVSVLADRGLILAKTDPKAAVAALEQVEQADPAFVSTHVYLSGIYLSAGDYAEFLAEGRTAAELNHDPATLAVFDEAQSVFKKRGPQAMLSGMAKGFAPLAERGSVPAYSAARMFALAGQREQTIHFLRLACDRREPGFISFERDPAFNLVRSSAEYRTLLVRRDATFSSGEEPIARLGAMEPI